jgi:YwiC-like protein
MVIPREHGAWGMLLIPLATGVAVALRSGIDVGALTLFIVAAMSLFWLRTPLEAWLGTSLIKAQTEQERDFVRRVTMAAGLVSATSIAALLWNGRNRGLLVIGVVAALAFAAQAGVKKLGRSGRMPAQVVGTIGLTSTAAGAYYVATGRLDRIALALWLANWLFVGDQIHFVQVRIHAGRAATLEERLPHGLPFLGGQVVLIGALLAGWRSGLFPAAIALAFAPVLVRGTLWFAGPRQSLNVHRLGFTELAHALIFGVLLCLGFLV